MKYKVTFIRTVKYEHTEYVDADSKEEATERIQKGIGDITSANEIFLDSNDSNYEAEQWEWK